MSDMGGGCRGMKGAEVVTREEADASNVWRGQTCYLNSQRILDASMHLYKRVRWSVGPLIRPSVSRSVRNAFFFFKHAKRAF